MTVGTEFPPISPPVGHLSRPGAPVFSCSRPLRVHCGRGGASPGDGAGLYEPHRSSKVVAGNHQGGRKVGSDSSNGADHLAAILFDRGEHLFEADAGKARVARSLPLGKRPMGLGLALDLRPVAFRRWVDALLPALGGDTVVAIDGKTSRRSGKFDVTLWHLVSTFTADSGLVLGQRATAEKKEDGDSGVAGHLGAEGCIVTIDAMRMQANIARAIRDRGAEYILALKENRPTLAASARNFFVQFQAAPERTPYTVVQTIEKDYGRGRIETRRCFAFSINLLG